MNEKPSFELEPIRIRVPVEIELVIKVEVTSAGETKFSLGSAAGGPKTFVAAAPPPRKPDAAVAEAVAPGSVEEQAYSQFDMLALRAPDFTWPSALSCCVASHLAYKPAAMVEQTFRTRYAMPCKFIEKSNTQCFVAHDNETILVSFRGTENLRDWISDFKVMSTASRMGMVHFGFYQAFQYVRQALEDLIDPLAGTRELVITGHSLGGAIAVIALGYWQARYKIRSVYTYGQPRVGLATFQEFAEDRKIDTKLSRLVNADDIVTRIPPGYVHIGHLYRFDSAGVATQLESAVAPVRRSGVTESLTIEADTDPPALSAEEFEMLRAECEAATDVAAMDSQTEGIFPNYFSDHFLNGYLTKILKQIPKPLR